MNVESFAEILEQELKEAFEVKNKKSLHNSVLIIAESLVKRAQYREERDGISNDIRLLTDRMVLGFEKMDQRFADMDKRFDDVNKRFEDVNLRFEDVNRRFEEQNKNLTRMFTYTNIALSALVLITVLFKFV